MIKLKLFQIDDVARSRPAEAFVNIDAITTVADTDEAGESCFITLCEPIKGRSMFLTSHPKEEVEQAIAMARIERSRAFWSRYPKPATTVTADSWSIVNFGESIYMVPTERVGDWHRFMKMYGGEEVPRWAVPVDSDVLKRAVESSS